MYIKEIIGILSALFVVASMVFKTTTYKGTMLMRSINAVGSALFIIYGFILTTAYATGITNVCGLVINVYWLFREYKDHKKSLLVQKVHI